MSKGTAIRPIRVPDDLYAEVNKAINSANLDRKDEPYTFTSWVLSAMRAKLRHNARGKKKGKVKR